LVFDAFLRPLLTSIYRRSSIVQAAMAATFVSYDATNRDEAAIAAMRLHVRLAPHFVLTALTRVSDLPLSARGIALGGAIIIRHCEFALRHRDREWSVSSLKYPYAPRCGHRDQAGRHPGGEQLFVEILVRGIEVIIGALGGGFAWRCSLFCVVRYNS
jgi:hypothetical protein